MTNFQINCHFKALKVYEQYCFEFFILVLSIIGGLNAKTAQEKAKPFTHGFFKFRQTLIEVVLIS
ncbi:MAG TPA: hypothetical protein DCM38_10100 [Gammaproteobacteria bacterium]|nr:hypothetical protein [Gammaproteobacteria bacterium]